MKLIYFERNEKEREVEEVAWEEEMERMIEKILFLNDKIVPKINMKNAYIKSKK